MAFRYRNLLVVLPLVALACGGRTVGGDDGGDGSGDDGGDAGGDDGGDDGGSSTGEDACQEHLNESDDAKSATITVRNTGEQTLFLGGLWSCDTAMMLVTPEGVDEGVRWPQQKCEFTCEEVFDSEGFGCDASCPIPGVIKIDPMGEYSMEWSGRLMHVSDPPGQCCKLEESCSGGCSVDRVARDGDHVATVNWFDEIDCLEMGNCDCSVGPEGSCELEGFAETIPDEGKRASVMFSYPSDGAVLEIP